MRLLRAAAAVLIVLNLAACGFIGDLPGVPRPAVRAQLEVFNRTELPIVLVSADGERMDVPACGRAQDGDFRVDAVRVGAAGWYVRGFGVGSDYDGLRLVLVEVARASESGIPEPVPAPDPLPPCVGQPQFQEGVRIEDLMQP